MKIEVTQTGFANLPAERKEFAGKAQMPEVLRESLTNLWILFCQVIFQFNNVPKGAYISPIWVL
jgi:hypothetical protein